MKRKFLHLISIFLCAVMLWSMLPGSTVHAAETAASAEITSVGTGENGEITFTTFAELKDLISEVYTSDTILRYVGNSDLVLEESIALPIGVYLLAETQRIVIPEGVAFTVSTELYAAAVTVNGSLYVGGIAYIQDELVINGEVQLLGMLFMNNGLDTVLEGGQRIIYDPDSVVAAVVWMCRFESWEDLKAIADAAYASQQWMYFIYAESETPIEIQTDESLMLYENCQFVINSPVMLTFSGDSMFALLGDVWVYDMFTVNGMLMLGGYTTVYAPLTVNKGFTNNGAIDIYYEDGGRLNISERITFSSATYSVIFITSDQATIPADAINGIDLNDFEIQEMNDAGHYWMLYNYEYNPDNDVPEVDPPELDDPVDPEPDNSSLTTPMYRLYNPNSGEHFYTGSTEERDMLVAAGWQYEGIAWNAPIYSGAPVYRVYNPNSGDHHYTMSQDEVDMLVSLGWQYEGVAWNSATTDDVPQFRLYNPNADCGSHHYTSSTEERDYLVSLGWIYEGIGWYGTLK